MARDAQADHRAWLFRQDWWAADLWVGAGVAAVVGAVPWFAPDLQETAAADGSNALYLTLIGSDVAILGAVLAVMAILAAFWSRSYRRLLAALPGGLGRTLATYRIVAWGAATAAVLTLLAFVFNGHHVWQVRSVTTALIVGMATWVLVGAAQLLTVTVNHLTDGTIWDEYVRRATQGPDPTSECDSDDRKRYRPADE